MLGYTKDSWDNLSGKEKQPSSSLKYWAKFTDNEKAGAAILGYTDKSWDNLSGKEAQPALAIKRWGRLRKCGKDPSIAQPLPADPSPLSSHSSPLSGCHHSLLHDGSGTGIGCVMTALVFVCSASSVGQQKRRAE